MKIDIEIKDNKKYGYVAFLIDREDFLRDIEKIRDQLGHLKAPYIFPVFPQAEVNRLVNHYTRGDLDLNSLRILLEEFCSEQKIANLYSLDKVLGGAVVFAESLLTKYKRSRNYMSVILAAILAGSIKDDDFSSTHMLQMNKTKLEEEFKRFDENNELVTINISPESTLKEVQNSFDFIQKYYFKTKRTKINDGLVNIYSSISPAKLADTVSNIRQHREWYWLKKSGKSWRQIKETSKKKITLRGIELAVKRYTNKLV